MTKASPTRGRVRTAAALKADAVLLAGTQSRVAHTATEDGGAAPAPEGDVTVGELWLYGVVGGWYFGFNAESVARAIRDLDVDVLYVRIHSPGGRAADGVAISNLLRNLTAKVIVVVDGLAASAASVIAIAGDEIVMCPGSQMMIHDASMWTGGNEAQLRRDADWIGKQSENYAGVYAYKAGGTPAEWRAIMTANDGEGTWYTAEETVAAKLADVVGTRPAVGSPPTSPEEQLQELEDGDDELFARIEHDLLLLEHEVHAAALSAWQGQVPSQTPKPPSASAVGSTHTEGGSAVSLSDQAVTTLRTKLGIAGDADEATILAALDEALDERADPDPAPTTGSPASATAAASAGEVAIPEVRLKDLEAAAASGVEAAKKLHAMERESFLDQHKSKFPATSRADWGKRFDKDPEGTRDLLTAAADLVPTGEVGHGDTLDASTGAGATTLAEVREDPTYQNWRM